MENYNLTAEIKKISGAINNSSPNTELGNINSGVGNLDTAMQSVASAIGNISIPNTGSNIDGVATAINNKSIPDPSSNITAVANAIVSMAGGKDLDDLIAILTTMNGNIANLGSNHITNINVAPAGTTGYFVQYGNGTGTPLPNLAEKTAYTDNNNIGATDVQGAVDYLVTNKVQIPNYDYQIPRMVVDQSGVNCNNLRNFGFYQVTNATNTPNNGSGWYTIMTIPMGANNTNYCHQFAINLNNNSLWHRYCNNGNWASWVTV